MEAVRSLARGGVPLVAQTRSLSGVTPVHANLSTTLRGVPVDDGSSSKKHRRIGRSIPLESQKNGKLTEKAATRSALRDLEDEKKSDKPKVRLPPADEVARTRGRDGGVGPLAKTVARAMFDFLQYTPMEEENSYVTGNFGPVEEIGEKVRLEVLQGAIPQNFPSGAYIRTGPNPLFGGKFYKSKLGITKYHWFEGDGMLHAVYFEKSGDEYKCFYKNKYVETEGYLVEKKEGKPIVLATLMGTPVPLVINVLLNQLRFGFQAKPTCNTSVWCHGGRVFAASENNLPYEIDISDLSTVGEFDCNGAWPLDTFTAHPKIDPITKELTFQGFSVLKKPFTKVGVISADGETVVHTIDVDVERLSLNHDIMITERYTVVMDFPLVMDPLHITKGKPIILFDHNGVSKFGIVPRFGDSNSIRWFEVETNALFHTFNAYDGGNEVVVHGLSAKSSFFNVDHNIDQANWYRRGITPGVPDQEGYDPLVDGALLTYLHEWRFDLEAGTVTEREITDVENYCMMEFPRINESYVGRKYRYGYALCSDLDQARKAALPFSGRICKVDFSSTEIGKGAVTTEFHELGPNRYGSEPMFVAKPGSTAEDDGWIVLYVHDESTKISELIIIDSQKFTEKPVARIPLPQRVPYGFHGTYVYNG